MPAHAEPFMDERVLGLFFTVKFNTEFYLALAAGKAVPVGVAQRIHATAIFLLIKIFLFGDRNGALAAAALAPIERPVA